MEAKELSNDLLKAESDNLPSNGKNLPSNGKSIENRIQENGDKNTKKETEENGGVEPQIVFPPPDVWPEKNMKPKKKKSKFGSITQLLCSSFSKVCLVLLGYIISCMNGALILLPLTVITLIWYETKSRRKTNKIKAKAKAISSNKQQLLDKIEELPSWVLFPDRERAEWVNDIVLQLWPNINCFLIKFVRSKLENQIRKKYDSFKFEEIDFGSSPPKIDGVKVYSRTTTRDSILIDFDIFYDGDCDITFSISGHQVGRLKNFQLSVDVRIVLKPLMLKAPIVGGVQIFFLNTPEIDFDLDGLSGIPGLSHVLRKQIEEKLKKKIVFPNKITKRFTKHVEATELKSLEPEGVLRIHIAEAKDLERRDVTGKSDPYAVFSVGAQEYKTSVIKRSLNPKWDEWCEFVILDPTAQQVRFKLFDHDDLNEDDFLGSGVVDIKSVYDGSVDHWIVLDGVKHGKIHLRFTWMSLTADYASLDKALHEVKLLKVAVSSALLTVYIDSARNLARIKSFKKPDPYLLMQVGNSLSQKSKVKKHTIDPIFEQGFSFLVKNPESDVFYVSIMDKHSNMKIDFFEYEIKNLVQENDLEFSMREFPLKSGAHDCVIMISMQLRILTNEAFSNDDDSSESFSDYELSRDDSVKSHVSADHPPVPETPLDIEPPVLSNDVPVTSSSPLKSPMFKRLNLLNKSLSSESHHNIDGDVHLGRIHVGLQYSDRRQKLMVTIFSIANIPVKDPRDIPDPYVKLKLYSGASIIRHKTKTIMDNPNAEFKETFEYLLSPSELKEQKLVLTIKTKKKLFSNNMLGQVLVDLKDLDWNEHHNKWYDIGHEMYPE
ncbi:extended synaptotagmin-2-like isoform X2 [Coccinella septempunctata]|uniref:extended synaptotagmin-2-like isoform X2 n=1 Tax=Coccinella septempunctata TaxID=41139 RepID=UPI001D073641|nr:extended synaptotagmin-2-like isoform X2 [Coccinella septempunctata]